MKSYYLKLFLITCLLFSASFSYAQKHNKESKTTKLSSTVPMTNLWLPYIAQFLKDYVGENKTNTKFVCSDKNYTTEPYSLYVYVKCEWGNKRYLKGNLKLNLLENRIDFKLIKTNAANELPPTPPTNFSPPLPLPGSWPSCPNCICCGWGPGPFCSCPPAQQ